MSVGAGVPAGRGSHRGRDHGAGHGMEWEIGREKEGGNRDRKRALLSL